MTGRPLKLLRALATLVAVIAAMCHAKMPE
jgi:hypothetical protein